MKILLLQIVILLVFHTIVKAQIDSSNNFVPDRPGMATPPNTLTSRNFQVEDGFQFEKYNDGNLRNENFLFSSLLLRYGLVKNFEVRIQSDFAYNKIIDSATTSAICGLNPLTIGTKIKFIEQRKAIPNISILFNLTIPFIGKKDFRPNNFAPSFCILMSNSISEKLNVCYNYGMSWDGSSSEPTHFYALCFGANLNTKWSAFVEGYGFSNHQTNSEFHIDAGFAYLINNHFQIDLSAAGYLNSFLNYYCLNAGIAWKI